MLKRCILAENRKLHASPIWILFFILPVISAAYGTFNYLQNLSILHERWYSLWTQHTLFYSLFFFPTMVGIYAAYLWRLEHLGHNWNLLASAPVHRMDIFLAKFLVIVKMVLLTQAFTFALYIFCGKVFAHFSGLPPMDTLIFLLRGVIGGLAVIAAQMILSILIRSFAVPVFIALFGGICGTVMASRGHGLWWPYSLMQVGMNSNQKADMLAGQYAIFLVICIVWLAALFVAASILMKKREIQS